MTSKIEWLRSADGKPGYTVNPVKGKCPMACPYCYARRMYDRFKWNPEIRWEPEHLLDLHLIPDGSRVFIGSTMELFGDWIPAKWLQDLFYWWIPRYPKHTFIFLTKQPQNLIKWTFPDNCWVGVSVINYTMANQARYHFGRIKARVKFLSIEPLLEPLEDRHGCQFILEHIQWVIIGQQTPIRPATSPRIEWVKDIVQAADKAGVPVFLKDNLWDLLYSKAWDDDLFWALPDKAKLRQEFPL